MAGPVRVIMTACFVLLSSSCAPTSAGRRDMEPQESATSKAVRGGVPSGSAASYHDAKIQELMEQQEAKRRAHDKARADVADEVMRESEQRYAEQRRAKAKRDECSRLLPSRHLLGKAERRREQEQKAGHPVGPNPKPSSLYDRFSNYPETIKKADERGCDFSRRESFEREWAYLQSREEHRQKAIERAKAAKAERERQEREWRASIVATAKKHGYDGVAFDHSVTEVILAMINEGVGPKAVSTKAITPGPMDDYLTARQVLGDGSALFVDDPGNVTIMLRGYSGHIYEGSSFSVVRSDAFKIAGVTSYTTAIGGTKQAFVVEPAW